VPKVTKRLKEVCGLLGEQSIHVQAETQEEKESENNRKGKKKQ
jgi:hypothetical protein